MVPRVDKEFPKEKKFRGFFARRHEISIHPSRRLDPVIFPVLTGTGPRQNENRTLFLSMAKRSPSLPLRVGLVGCGTISNAYFKGMKPFPGLVQIVACSDLDVSRAKAKAAEHGVAKACPVPQLLDDPEIDLVLNLTVPGAHAAVNLQALQAGKHAYC